MLIFLATWVAWNSQPQTPNPTEELMAAINDLKDAVTRLESVRDRLVENIPVDLTPELVTLKDHVNAVSDSLEAVIPPAPPAPENPA